jgi:hypothetical protein
MQFERIMSGGHRSVLNAGKTAYAGLQSSRLRAREQKREAMAALVAAQPSKWPPSVSCHPKREKLAKTLRA